MMIDGSSILGPGRKAVGEVNGLGVKHGRAFWEKKKCSTVFIRVSEYSRTVLP